MTEKMLFYKFYTMYPYELPFCAHMFYNCFICLLAHTTLAVLTTPDAYQHSYGNTYEVTLIGEGAEMRILRPLEPFYFQEREPEMSGASKLTHKDEASAEGFFRGALGV